MDTFTLIHVVISLVGIFSGLVVLAGLLAARLCKGWTALFLVSTIATSVTGFFFPFHRFLPAHGVGIISLLILPVVIYALYFRRLAGPWCWIYIVGAMFSLYLNVFVLVVQLFQKVAAFKTFAPTQSEPPFVIAQSVVLLVFVILGFVTLKKSRHIPADLI